MLDSDSQQLNTQKKKNIEIELKTIIRQIGKFQQANIQKNNIFGYQDFKEKVNVLLDVWRQANNESINDTFVDRYLDIIILLIEDICMSQEGFFVPRDSTGKLVNLDVGPIKMLNLHNRLNKTDYFDTSVWNKIVTNRKNNKPIFEVLESKKNTPREKQIFKYNIFLQIKALIFTSDMKTYISFQLYNNKTDLFVTEKYIFEVEPKKDCNISGMDTENRAVYTGLNSIDENLHLVCRMFKTAQQGGNEIYYPYGGFCVPLRDMKDLKAGKLFNPPPSTTNIFTPSKDSEFIHLHKLLIKGEKTYPLAKNSKSIIIALFHHQGDLYNIVRNNSGKKLDSYIPIACLNNLNMNQVEVEPYMKITISGGNFMQESIKYQKDKKIKQTTKKKPKNIEVEFQLINSDGKPIHKCFTSNKNGQNKLTDSYKLFVISHENQPEFDDYVYITQSEKKLKNSTILITYKHVSLNSNDKACIFGFSFLPVCENKKILLNDKYNLSVYCASNPYIEDNKYVFRNDFVKRKDNFVIDINYNSNTYSSDDTLTELFNWKKAKNYEKLLDDLLKVNKKTLTKNFINTLNNLIKMMDSNFDESEKERIFNRIFWLINVCLFEEKTHPNNEMNVLDALKNYIGNDLTFPNLHSHLLQHFEICVQKNAKNSLIDVFSLFEFLIEMIFVSETMNMTGNFESVYKAFNITYKFLAESTNVHVKVIILGKITNALKSVKSILNEKTLIEFYFGAFASIEKCISNSEILKAKYILLNEMFDFGIKIDKETSNVFLSNSLRQLNLEKIQNKNQINNLRQCFVIVNKVMSLMRDVKFKDDGDKLEVVLELAKIFPKLIFYIHFAFFKEVEEKSTIWSLNQNTDLKKVKQNSLVCCIQILQYCFESQINIWDVCRTTSDFYSFYPKFFQVALAAVDKNLFDAHWIAMKIFIVNTISSTLSHSLGFLEEMLEENYNYDLNLNILQLIVSVINDAILNRSNDSKTKKEYIETNLVVNRKSMCNLLIKFLKMMKGKIVNFTQYFMANFFVLKEEDEDYIECASEIYYYILYWEYKERGNLKNIEGETINAMSIALKENNFDLIGVLLVNFRKKLEEGEHDEFFNTSIKFVESIGQINTYTKKLGKSNDIDEKQFEYEQIDIFMKLLSIFEEKQYSQKEVYLNYYKRLVDIHAFHENWVEAGIALERYIKMNNWKEVKSEELNGMTINELKVYLLRICIDYFTNGKDWQRCINICELLENHFLENEGDFMEISKIMIMKSEFYKSMSMGQAIYQPYYYKVKHYGNFEPEVKEFEWIYRSKELEQLNVFSKRILKMYPDAEIVSTKEAGNEANSSKKMINITTMSIPPVKPTVEQRKLKNWKEILEYGRDNNISELYSSTLIQKGEKNTFKKLWQERTYYKIEGHFPSIKRKAKVVSIRKEMISPIFSAIEAIEAQTYKLESVLAKVRKSENIKSDIKILTLNLQGIIDAAVSGGTKVYIDEFFNSSPLYIEIYPDEKENTVKFIDALKDQDKALQEGLDFLEINMFDNEALFNHLSEMYKKMLAANENLMSSVG